MSRTWLLATTCTALILLAGCMAPGANPPEGEIAFETLDQGQQSNIEEEHTRTVRTQGELEALYQEHAPSEEPPDVDLEEHLVLAIFKGQSPDACHGAQITNITGVNDDTIHVTGEFVEVTGTACAEVITYPYHIVTIDRYDANITYQIEHTQRDASQGQDDQREDDDQDNADPDESDQETPPEGPIAFETLEEGQQSNIEDERTQTVQDQNAWETLYDEHNPDEEPPMVDFNETIVLAAFKKAKAPTGATGPRSRTSPAPPKAPSAPRWSSSNAPTRSAPWPSPTPSTSSRSTATTQPLNTISNTQSAKARRNS